MGDVVRTPWSAGSPVCGRRWRSFQIESDIDIASGVQGGCYIYEFLYCFDRFAIEHEWMYIKANFTYLGSHRSIR